MDEVEEGKRKFLEVVQEIDGSVQVVIPVTPSNSMFLISLTKGLAIELGRFGITVNAVCPGVTRTPMTSYITDDMEREWARYYPLGRLGRPEDIAPIIAFLASSRNSFMTGQVVVCDGGYSIV